ncbi:MAG: YaaR family protein [Treponema sp.]|jgi:uncharacterized protein YaaR (DUF327 family)|nr:YaaR family protein [Treponema sp.]
MVKVDGHDYSSSNLSNTVFYTAFKTEAKKKGETQKSGRAKKLFSSLLKTQTLTENAPAAAESSFSDLTVLLDEVHSAGDNLAKRPFPDEIKRYRITIQNFMRYVLNNAYDVKEDEGIPNYLKGGFDARPHKRDPELRKAKNKYSTVHIVDKKLDELAAGIMIGQLKQITLLESIEEINGLLVDLLE